MTPLQVVTHLWACIQLSDGDADFEERKSWQNTIITLFPSLSQNRADQFLNEAHTYLNNATRQEFILHTERVIHRIKEALSDATVEIQDLAGDGNHYSATITSAKFSGKSKIEQHKMVYNSLKGKMGNELHALAIKTKEQ